MRRFFVLAALGLTLALGLLVGAANAPTAEATLPIDVTTVLQASITPDVPPGTRWEGMHGVLYTNCTGPNRRAIFALPQEEFGLGTTRLTADLTRLYAPRGWRLLQVEYKTKDATEFRRIDSSYFACTALFADLAISAIETTGNKIDKAAIKVESLKKLREMIKAAAENDDLSSINGKTYITEGQIYHTMVIRLPLQ